MGALISFEVKKILGKKSTLVAFFVLFALHIVFVCISGNLGSTYVDGEFYETHYERNKINRANGIVLSGRKIDEELLMEMTEAYQKIDWSTSDYMWTDIYKNEVRKYSDLENRLKSMGLWSNVLSEAIAEKTIDSMTMQKMEILRNEMQHQMYDSYELSKQENAFWEKQNSKVEIPFSYEYASFYESMLGGQGVYMVCMLLTFFIAMSMVSVFTEEHNRKTDQLILCARFGRDKLYMAKIVAGGLVVFTVNLLFIITAIVGKSFSYGPEGFEAMIQLLGVYWYPFALSAGETVLIEVGLLFLSSIMVAVFAMVLAEVTRSNVGAMAIVVGGLFLARLVSIPPSWGVLSQLWNYIPINMLKIDEGLTDVRLISIFDMHFTTWQFAPVLYIVLSAIIVWIGSQIYRNYQVSGR